MAPGVPLDRPKVIYRILNGLANAGRDGNGRLSHQLQHQDTFLTRILTDQQGAVYHLAVRVGLVLRPLHPL